MSTFKGRLRSMAAAAVLGSAAFMTPAYAVNCANGSGAWSATFADGTSGTWTACTGAWDGNLADNTTTALATLIANEFAAFSPGPVPYAGKSGDVVPGPFTPDIPGSTVASGTLGFGAGNALTGWFVVGLHGGDQTAPIYDPAPVAGGGSFSLYLFDGNQRGGITSINFSMLGTSVNNQGAAQNLSHAALYGGSVVAVPEPSAYALALIGLGMLGWVARGRRQRR